MNAYENPLNRAVIDGDIERVKMLIKEGTDINTTLTQYNWSILHTASWRNHVNIVEYLLDEGMDINCENNEGATPLSNACYFANPEVVEVLLQRGANPNTKHHQPDKSDLSPLECALTFRHHRHYNVIAVFLEQEIQVKQIKTCIGEIIENSFPAYAEQRRLVKACLERNIAVEEIRKFSTDFYSSAAEDGNVPLAKLLCEKYPERINDFLHQKLEHGNKTIAKFLIDNKLAINALDKKGRTPLYVAAEEGDLKMVNLLLKNGAINPTVDHSPKTIAMKRGHGDIAARLDTKTIPMES